MTEDLGPLLLAPEQYLDVRRSIRKALGFPHERRPILIGVDGLDGSGKSSLAAWLSWQLEMPAIHLDLYVIPDTDPLEFRTDHLAAAVCARLETRRPLIVEGILLLDVLASVGRRPDFLIYVEKEGNRPSSTLSRHLNPYLEKQPRERANRVLKWSSAEHDAKVARAHQRA
jgi:uridine kinase